MSPAACAERLAVLFPALFGAAPQPLKLRIQADIQQRAPGVFSKKALSAFLHRYTTGNAYLKAMQTAPERVDLDGQPAGAVAEEHRAAAVAEWQRRRTLQDERRAAERATQRQAQRDAGAARQLAQQARHMADEAQRMLREAQRQAQDAQRAVQTQQRVVEDRAFGERAALLRAFETTTLKRANFCALKRIPVEALDAMLDQAWHEREAHRQSLPPAAAPEPAAQPPRGRRDEERSPRGPADDRQRPPRKPR